MKLVHCSPDDVNTNQFDHWSICWLITRRPHCLGLPATPRRAAISNSFRPWVAAAAEATRRKICWLARDKDATSWRHCTRCCCCNLRCAAALRDSLSIAHCASATSDKFIYAASRTSCRFPSYWQMNGRIETFLRRKLHSSFVDLVMYLKNCISKPKLF